MNRLSQLDGLRALAVLGVMLHHAVKWEVYFPLGPYSVRLFFVLSGFLITGILLRARAATTDCGYVLRAFYARRFLRIFPVYYASLAVLWMLGQSEIRETIWWHVFYLSNFLAARPGADVPTIWGHLWSLSVEEQFYLLWPALVLFCPRRWVPAALVAATMCGPAFRLVVSEFWHYKPAVYLMPGCLDSLGLGALLAWIAGQPAWNAQRNKLAAIALALGLLVVAATLVLANLEIGTRFRIALGDVGAALCSVWLVNGAANRFRGWFGALLDWRVFTFIGTISYGLYLFHNFVPYFAEYAGYPLPEHGVVRFIVLTAVTVPLGAASWILFEGPLNQLKDHFPYQARMTVPVSQGVVQQELADDTTYETTVKGHI